MKVVCVRNKDWTGHYRKLEVNKIYEAVLIDDNYIFIKELNFKFRHESKTFIIIITKQEETVKIEEKNFDFFFLDVK
jgi:hypothetical protein